MERSKSKIEGTEAHTISQFPPVEDDEIHKHRLLNEEAEKNSSGTNTKDVHPSYLKRLQLERRILLEKERQLKLAKKRLSLQSKRKQNSRELTDLFKMLKTPTPQPIQTRIVEGKPVNTVLGFRYSKAIEEHYRGQLRNFGKYTLSLLSDVDLDLRDRMENGWLVRHMGANVLNLNAQSLPSCNPVELRLRRRIARIRGRESLRERSFIGLTSRDKSLFGLKSQFSRESTCTQLFPGSQNYFATRHSNDPADLKREASFNSEFFAPSESIILPDLNEHKDGKRSSLRLEADSDNGDNMFATSPGSPVKMVPLKLPDIV